MSTIPEELPRETRRIGVRQLARRQGLVEVLQVTEGLTKGELARVLQEAARDASASVEFNLRTVSGQVRSAQLQAATRGLGGLSSNLWSQIGGQVRGGIRDAAQLAANQQLLRELQMGMPGRVIQQYSGNMFFNALQSANDIISRRTNGFTLSRRILRNDKATVLRVGRIIDRALAQQLSAREIARQVRIFFSPRTPGGASYAAKRLACTEINNAHHSTSIRLSKDRPWTIGYRWHLSGSHPRPDECDQLAHEDHEGLGAGVFSKGGVPRKPHPQCLCYVLVIQPPREEFLENLAGGRYDNYLEEKGVFL